MRLMRLTIRPTSWRWSRINRAVGCPAGAGRECPSHRGAEGLRHRTDWDAAIGSRPLLAEGGVSRFHEGFGPSSRRPSREGAQHPPRLLLPSFPGARPVADAVDYGVKITGCTVHVIDAGIDWGRSFSGHWTWSPTTPPSRCTTGSTSGTAAGGRGRRSGGQPRTAVRRKKGDHPVSRTKVTRALVSTYDKEGLAELAVGLAAAGVEIVSTGSTARVIAEAGVPVTQVADVTGFP